MYFDFTCWCVHVVLAVFLNMTIVFLLLVSGIVGCSTLEWSCWKNWLQSFLPHTCLYLLCQRYNYLILNLTYILFVYFLSSITNRCWLDPFLFCSELMTFCDSFRITLWKLKAWVTSAGIVFLGVVTAYSIELLRVIHLHFLSNLTR